MIALSIAIVVSVLIICGTVARVKRPAPHVHKWWTEGIYTIQIWSRDPTVKYPTRRETHFSQSCEGCGEKRIEIVDGQWKNMDGEVA